MNKEEYLKQCGVESARQLTAEQILDYFIQGYGGPWNKVSAKNVQIGRLFGLVIDRAKAIAMLRQAFDKDKDLIIGFVDGEGVSDVGANIEMPRITMKFRKS